jgi:hypothetical protein
MKSMVYVDPAAEGGESALLGALCVIWTQKAPVEMAGLQS